MAKISEFVFSIALYNLNLIIELFYKVFYGNAWSVFSIEHFVFRLPKKYWIILHEKFFLD